MHMVRDLLSILATIHITEMLIQCTVKANESWVCSAPDRNAVNALTYYIKVIKPRRLYLVHHASVIDAVPSLSL